MKNKTLVSLSRGVVRVALLLFVTGIAAWILPALARMATDEPGRYPFVYYSSLLKELCMIDYGEEEFPLTTLSGKRYTEAECDSLLPLLNYRQLLSDGKMPDSIDGVEISPPLLRSKSVIFRYSPRVTRSPGPRLHVLFESMPRRVGIEMPGDMFRLVDRIEFIDCETNRVDGTKSARFQQAMERRGFRFPARQVSGNPNPRKSYDEGYFVLDATGRLFHLKMVNGKPYVRDTRVDEQVEVAAFSVIEPADKRFYGILFGARGEVYILEARDGGYHPLRLDIPPFDTSRDRMVIMGNLLYWNVAVTTPSGRDYHALRTGTLENVATYRVDYRPGPWERFSSRVFPCYLTFDDPDSAYIYPRLHFTGWRGWWVHLLLAALAGCLLPGGRRQRAWNMLYILLAGFAGLLALLALPRFITKKTRR